MRRFYIATLIMLVSVFGTFFLTNHKVEALTQQFPDSTIFTPSTDSSHGYLEVSLLGGGNTLSAPQTAVNILFTTPGLHAVLVQDGKSCEAPLGGGVDFLETQNSGAATTNFRFFSNRSAGSIARGNPVSNAGNCSNPDVQLTTTVGPADKFDFNGQSYYAIELRATAISGNGGLVNAFKVITEPDSYVVLPETTGLNGPDSYFAIQRRPGAGSGDRTFALYMAPDCSLAPYSDNKTHSSTFSFYDDDHGASFEINNPPSITIQVADKGTGNWANYQFTNVSGLSGNGPGWLNFTTANGGSGTGGSGTFNADDSHQYRMLIRDVSGENGIRFTLPFTESGNVNGPGCQPPPQQENAVCANTPVRVYLKPGDSTSASVSLKNTGDAPWTAAFNLYNSGSVPGGASGSVTGANPPSPPVNKNATAKFTVNVSVSNGATDGQTYNVNFQMKDASGNPFGDKCPVIVSVTNNGPPGAICDPLPVVTPGSIYPGQTATYNIQFQNTSGGRWDNYQVLEYDPNLGGWHSIGIVNVNNGGHTRQFPIAKSETSDLQLYYRVVNATGAGVGNFDTGWCKPFINVINPVPKGSIGGGLGASCKVINYEVHWEPASGNSIRTIIRTPGYPDRVTTDAPGTHSFDPFTDPAFSTVPIDQQVSYRLFAQNADGSTFSDLGEVTIGPCLTHSCIPASGIDVEPNETTSIGNLGGFTIANDTNRNDPLSITTSVGGASVAYPNPYGFSGTSGLYVVPASGPITASTSPITITRTLNYRGAVINTYPCGERYIPKSRPYLKVFGADVSAGGWFNNGNNSCAGNTNVQDGNKGGIRTFASANVAGHTYRAGSSSEFAAYALGLIDSNNASRYGFYTRSLQPWAGPAVTTMNPLDFANNPPDGQLGFTSAASCIKDYYSNVTAGPTTSISGDLGGIPGNVGGAGPRGANTSRIFNHGTSSFSIGGGAWQFNPGERLTIYVAGDVYINTNINYSTSELNPSYFTLVVKGNIYIAGNVTKLEGLYIAQPDATNVSSTGNIWTCSVAAAGNTLVPPDFTQAAPSCQNKLTINGAVIAKHVTFNRVGNLTANTLSKVIASDPETSSAVKYGNSNALGTNKAVEEINYIPDMVIGSPYLVTTGSSSRFDAITVLPPLF